MSLKVTDWKAVLNQPKNLGLKAGGGTGIGKALENLAAKEASFQGEHDFEKKLERAHEGEKAAKDLKELCDHTVAKHRAVFTSACEYLTRVRGSAAAEERIWAQRVERGNHQAARIERAKAAKRALALCCHDEGFAAAESSTTLDQLHTAWAKFGADLKHKIDEYEHGVGLVHQGLQEHWHHIRDMDPKDEVEMRKKGPQAGFVLVRKDCKKMAEEMFAYAKGLGVEPGFLWP